MRYLLILPDFSVFEQGMFDCSVSIDLSQITLYNQIPYKIAGILEGMHIMETAAHFQPLLDFSQRVKALRKRLGFSQEQFADMFAVSSATVKLWEKGGLYPTQQDWQRIMLGEVEGVEALHSNGHTRKTLHCSFSK